MNWTKLIDRAKTALAGRGTKTDLDKKLFRRLRPYAIPSWPQLKYLGRFLRPLEKRLLLALTGVACLATFGWLGIFIVRHSGSAPKVGGEYREALIGQPKYVNPIFSSISDVDSDLVALIYSGLFQYDSNQKLVTDLAEKYTASADLKTYEITLRADAKWSDGMPITIDDVIFTFETIQNPEVGSPLTAAFEGIKIEKISERGARFILKEPYAFFINSLTVGLLPEHVWAQIEPAALKLSKYNLQPIGSGTWRFEKMAKNESGEVQNYTLVPNINYYGAKPYFTSVELKFFANFSDAITALKGQLVDAIAFVPNELKEKISQRNYAAYQILLPQITALFFNPDKKAELKDADVRAALTLATPRDKIINEAQGGNAVLADSPLPTISAAHRAGVKYGFNPEEADKILDKKYKKIEPEEYFRLRRDAELKNYQAEIDAAKANTTTPEIVSTTLERIEKEIAEKVRAEMSAEQTFYRASGDKILQITIAVAENPEYQKTAAIIAAAWRKIGVQTSIKVVTAYQINREIIRDRNYDTLIYGEITGADFDLFPFWHSSQIKYPGLNLANYSNRDADKLLETVRATADEPERMKLINKFQELVDASAPAIFLYTPAHWLIADKNIQGIKINALTEPSDRYNYLGQWFVKTKWKWKK